MPAQGTVIAIIQARTGSARLPGKVLADVGGLPLLARVIRRTRRATSVDAVCVATTTAPSDDPVAAVATAEGAALFRGSVDDVLARYAGAARELAAGTVVRVTGDNPLVGFDVIDWLVADHRTSGAALTSGYHARALPNGTVVSAISSAALAELDRRADQPAVREHVVTGLELLGERGRVARPPVRWRRPDLRYCVDDAADLEVVRGLAGALPDDATTGDLIALLDRRDDLRALNRAAAERGY
jgi:spore coat polysaccharide biosynthesis protein SpsF